MIYRASVLDAFYAKKQAMKSHDEKTVDNVFRDGEQRGLSLPAAYPEIGILDVWFDWENR